MKTYTVTTKTYKALAAEFATTFKDIKPIAPTKATTLADALEPYRPHILKQRQRGLSWEQIAGGMSAPLINMKVSGSALRKLFGAEEQVGKAAPRASNSAAAPARAVSASATPSPANSAVAPATLARRRLLLDPATNLPIAVP